MLPETKRELFGSNVPTLGQLDNEQQHLTLWVEFGEVEPLADMEMSWFIPLSKRLSREQLDTPKRKKDDAAGDEGVDDGYSSRPVR